jgi:hypothetical protein
MPLNQGDGSRHMQIIEISKRMIGGVSLFKLTIVVIVNHAPARD